MLPPHTTQLHTYTHAHTHNTPRVRETHAHVSSVPWAFTQLLHSRLAPYMAACVCAGSTPVLTQIHMYKTHTAAARHNHIFNRCGFLLLLLFHLTVLDIVVAAPRVKVRVLIHVYALFFPCYFLFLLDLLQYTHTHANKL